VRRRRRRRAIADGVGLLLEGLRRVVGGFAHRVRGIVRGFLGAIGRGVGVLLHRLGFLLAGLLDGVGPILSVVLHGVGFVFDGVGLRFRGLLFATDEAERSGRGECAEVFDLHGIFQF